jgi:DNA-nicking Smr family endonuclease
MLRRLREAVAIAILAQRVPLHARAGDTELLVVVGKGRGSPGGESILGPAVRAWCAANPRWVSAVREAPAREGGQGVLILSLRRPR